MHREITELNITEFLTNTIEEEISSVLTKVGFQQKPEEEFNMPEGFHNPEYMHTSINVREPKPIESDLCKMSMILVCGADSLRR